MRSSQAGADVLSAYSLSWDGSTPVVVRSRVAKLGRWIERTDRGPLHRVTLVADDGLSTDGPLLAAWILHNFFVAAA